MMPGLGQHVQHRGQLGQRGGGEPQPFGRQAADVDPQRHPHIITDRTADDGVG
jgi:hypothetical protein